MKKTILFLLVAVLAVATMSAQGTKKALYVIDGNVVENFDGSQLQGKTIVSYTIEPECNIHTIITSAFDTKGRKISNVKSVATSKVESVRKVEELKDAKICNVSSESVHIDSGKEAVFVMNGKIVTYSEIKDIPSSNIVSINVIKNKKDADYIKYAKAAKQEPKCVVKVTTK